MFNYLIDEGQHCRGHISAVKWLPGSGNQSWSWHVCLCYASLSTSVLSTELQATHTNELPAVQRYHFQPSLAKREHGISRASLLWSCTWSTVGESTEASADLSCFKSMWLIFHACWPEALWHCLNCGGARAVNWLAEGQPRGADIREMADFKEAAKGLSLGPGLLEA